MAVKHVSAIFMIKTNDEGMIEMLIGGKEFEMDVFEAGTAEKLENGLKKVQAACAPAQEAQNASDIIRAQCAAVFELFDSLFGEGTSKDVFGEKVSLTAALDAFDALIAEINRQKAEMTARTEKYAKVNASV